MNIKQQKHRFGSAKKGLACQFNIELQSLSCLIQQQQQQQARKSIFSGFKPLTQMIDAVRAEIDNGTPKSGTLQKRILITWKRGHKKGGKIVTATYNTETNEYDFDRKNPSFSFVATMEPVSPERVSTSNPTSLIEQSWRRKELKISIEELDPNDSFTNNNNFNNSSSSSGINLLLSSSPQQQSSSSSLLLNQRKICSFVYDLSDVFSLMKQNQQRLGESCTVTLPMMTLTSKSFVKVVVAPTSNNSNNNSNSSTSRSSFDRKRFSTGLFGNLGKKPTNDNSSSNAMSGGGSGGQEQQHDLTNPSTGGLLLMKMDIEPRFVDYEEETVDSDTHVSVDNVMTEDDGSLSDDEEQQQQQTTQQQPQETVVEGVDVGATRSNEQQVKGEEEEVRSRSFSSSSLKSPAHNRLVVNERENAMTRSASLDILAANQRPDNHNNSNAIVSGSPDLSVLKQLSQRLSNPLSSSSSSSSSSTQSQQQQQQQSQSPSSSSPPLITLENTAENEEVVSPLSDRLNPKKVYSLFDSLKKPKLQLEDALSRIDFLNSENSVIKNKLEGAEQALVQYKLQVESLLSREAENSQLQKSTLESQIQSLNDEVKQFQERVVTLESSNAELIEERSQLIIKVEALNAEISQLKESMKTSEQQHEADAEEQLKQKTEEQNQLQEKLTNLESEKEKLEKENQNLLSELQKMRVRIKQQESQLLAAVEDLKKERELVVATQKESTTVVEEQSSPLSSPSSPSPQTTEDITSFNPCATAIVWGFICTFCIILAFPFIHQVLASTQIVRSATGSRTLEDELQISEYIFRHGLACFGVITLFSTFGLNLARRLNMHMNGTYLMKTVRNVLLVPSLDISSMLSFDNEFIDNAKLSCLWGLVLGLVIKFVDWLFFFRWIIPSTTVPREPLSPVNVTSSDNVMYSNATTTNVANLTFVSINTVALWKRLFYTLYCAVSDELLGRLFLFLLFVELARRARIYLIQTENKESKSNVVVVLLRQYGRRFLKLNSIDVEESIKEFLNANVESPTESQTKKSKKEDVVEVQVDDGSVSAPLKMNGRLNGVIISAMIASSVLFALSKCPWEMTVYPPTNVFMWFIALVRCLVIHGATSLIYCYMFFVQQNIEFVILAHGVSEFVFHL